ncbi:MAG: hypothetical protein JWM36_3411 [Hyphomicrobiales bacterium]|nr:hypothetical protein [Hyphomicrobiales bacterium]
MLAAVETNQTMTAAKTPDCPGNQLIPPLVAAHTDKKVSLNTANGWCSTLDHTFRQTSHLSQLSRFPEPPLPTQDAAFKRAASTALTRPLYEPSQ